MIRVPFRHLCLWLLLSCLMTTSAYAKIYYSKQEAMELAFGEGAEVNNLSLFLKTTKLRKFSNWRALTDSALFTFTWEKAGEILGYAAIETHKVRTKPETVLIVLDAQGQLTQVQTLAFHEPPEYEPTKRWYAQMYQLPLDEISFRAKVQGISGATLSSRAAIDSVRRVLAVYQVSVAEKP